MDRSPRWIAVLVAGLAVLAGCSAGGGQPTDAAPSTAGVPTTSVGSPIPPTDTPEPDPATPTPPDGPPYETPLNATTVLRAHDYAVVTSGSYTFDTELRITQLDSDWGVHDRWLVRADLESGRMYLERNRSNDDDHIVYVDGSGNGYEPTTINGKETYRRPPERLSDPVRFVTPNLRLFIENIDFTAAGTETRGGETVYVYTARNVSRVGDNLLDLRYYYNGTIRSVNATLVIAESGVVRDFSYRINGTDLEGDTIIYSAPMSYREVGNTSVTEPPWLDEARAVLDDE